MELMGLPDPAWMSDGNRAALYCGDCREVMPTLPDEYADSIVCDPPYGLSFMGKGWDHGVPGCEFWQAAMRVAKPGAHLLAFGGTRTFHRLAVAIEDAGWEIRDCVMWVYGSGFPKSLDVGKAIDKAAGVEREVVGKKTAGMGSGKTFGMLQSDGANHLAVKEVDITAPATPEARKWDGWGTALKPAWEPIIVARKPLAGTVAENVLRYGTGAINVDGVRLDCGRWPANIIHDGSDEVVAGFPGDGDESASRFFYCAKASKADRDEGCDGLPKERPHPPGNEWGTTACFNGESGDDAWKKKHPNLPRCNHHPTVKPTALMRYLCRLVTQPGGVILDPFMGSGSTGKAAMADGFRFIGIEREPEYLEIASRRIGAAVAEAANREGVFHAST